MSPGSSQAQEEQACTNKETRCDDVFCENTEEGMPSPCWSGGSVRGFLEEVTSELGVRGWARQAVGTGCCRQTEQNAPAPRHRAFQVSVGCVLGRAGIHAGQELHGLWKSECSPGHSGRRGRFLGRKVTRSASTRKTFQPGQRIRRKRVGGATEQPWWEMVKVRTKAGAGMWAEGGIKGSSAGEDLAMG